MEQSLTVKELIKILLDYNMDAPITAIVNNRHYNFTMTFGGSEGVSKETAEEVAFYIDELNK